MKRVFLLNAPPSSGKDEVAKYLATTRGLGTHAEIKEKLFELTCAVYCISREDFMAIYSTELKEKPDSRLRGLSPRQALIKVSEEMLKPVFGKRYFGEAAALSLKEGDTFFSDSGFYDEAEAIRDVVGKENLFIIRIHRPGYTYERFNDSRRYLTDEECERLAADYIDIHNDGTLEEFFVQVLDYVMGCTDEET
jgi:hypothetical protein